MPLTAPPAALFARPLCDKGQGAEGTAGFPSRSPARFAALRAGCIAVASLSTAASERTEDPSSPPASPELGPPYPTTKAPLSPEVLRHDGLFQQTLMPVNPLILPLLLNCLLLMIDFAPIFFLNFN